MNEKEIAKEIMRQQWGCEGAIWKGLPLEVVQEWGETISYWLEIANNRAAHAIVERMKAKVVWEGDGVIKQFRAWTSKPPESWVEISPDGPDGPPLGLPPGTGVDGQRVRVTVEEVEDGQE